MVRPRFSVKRFYKWVLPLPFMKQILWAKPDSPAASQAPLIQPNSKINTFAMIGICFFKFLQASSIQPDSRWIQLWCWVFTWSNFLNPTWFQDQHKCDVRYWFFKLPHPTYFRDQNKRECWVLLLQVNTGRMQSWTKDNKWSVLKLDNRDPMSHRM